MRQRMIKSAEEIAVITQGARIGDLGGAAVKAAIRGAAIAEYEVALIGTEAMVREIARTFPDSEIRDTWVWFQSGINTDGAHNRSTTRAMRARRHPVAQLLPDDSGYYTALERTLFLGEPDDASSSSGRSTSRCTTRPGADQARRRVQDIARELNEIFAEHDLLQYRTFGYGHSFGVLSTTTAGRPDSSCARTSTPCWSPAWSCRWSR